MGATNFVTKAKGKTAEEAFRSAVEEARYEYGHGGYTGTIAEKHDFIMIRKEQVTDEEAKKIIDDIFGADKHEEVCDKWGKAGCLKVGEDVYVFFGWASC